MACDDRDAVGFCSTKKLSGGRLCQLCPSCHEKDADADADAACCSSSALLHNLRGGEFVSFSRAAPVSHWSYVLGTGLLLCDVHQVVHPLLVLTAIQAASFLACWKQYSTVVALNMASQAFVCLAFLGKVINLMTGLSPATLTTVFLFASSQFIATNPKFFRVPFSCHRHVYAAFLPWATLTCSRDRARVFVLSYAR